MQHLCLSQKSSRWNNSGSEIGLASIKHIEERMSTNNGHDCNNSDPQLNSVDSLTYEVKSTIYNCRLSQHLSKHLENESNAYATFSSIPHFV